MVREARCVWNITLPFQFSISYHPLAMNPSFTCNNKTIFFFFSPSRCRVNLSEIVFFSSSSFFQAIHQGYTGTNLRTWPFSCLFSFSSKKTCTKWGSAHKLHSKPFCFTCMPTNIILIYCRVRILLLTVYCRVFMQLLQSWRITKPDLPSVSQLLLMTNILHCLCLIIIAFEQNLIHAPEYGLDYPLEVMLHPYP